MQKPLLIELAENGIMIIYLLLIVKASIIHQTEPRISQKKKFLKNAGKGTFIAEPFIRQEERKSITTIVLPIKGDLIQY